jgi:hypothetical protein
LYKSDNWSEAIYEQQRAEAENVDMSSGSEEGDALKQAVAANYGDDAEVDGNTITYTDESGETQEVELTDEQFRDQYAAM